ncbi:MAG: RNA 2',3'-cyclic phosphodiesterase [Candidatus Loosdrechtia sp.]|uniref:2'-5' RNA ligase family protein n=1 Tax=Candidatus Loosdrechtia sp. TaxID=3101272 RepID=UPI003A722BD8|nr:MAG: RNA 2',3'-cyclic phosphodiesterase [Candidatus Jettenia sp. AMX2]
MDVRLFVAVEIAEEIRKKLVELQNELKRADAEVGWVAPENFHITLKFIGTVDEEKMNHIIPVIKDSVAHMDSFDLRYKGIGVFPTEKKPRILFVNVIDSGGVLTKIHKRLDSQLASLQVKQENRPYDVHLTIGRIKTYRNIKELIEILHLYDWFNFGSEHITQVVLMKSVLSSNGPRYTKLHSANLNVTKFI